MIGLIAVLLLLLPLEANQPVAIPAAAQPTAVLTISPSTALPASSSLSTASKSPTAVEGAGLTNGQSVEPEKPVSAPAPAAVGASPTPTTEAEPALNKVVTQLNAKLGSDVTTKHGRDLVQNLSHSAASVGAMPAPPAPPSHLNNLHAQQAALLALNPHLAGAQQQLAVPHALAQHQQLLAGHPGLLPGQPQPAFIQTPAGLVPIQQPPLLQGQPQAQLVQTPQGLVQAPQHLMLPNGMALARPGMPQLMQVPGAAPHLQNLLGQQLIRQQLLQAVHARAQTPEATHVPTAGYVANNVSGYTPANSVPPSTTQLGQPIPVVANGVVGGPANASALQQLQQQQQQSAQPQQNLMMQMAAVPGAAGVQGMFSAPGMPAAAGLPGLASMPGLVQQSIGGLIMTPSPAGLPSIAGQPLLQKMPALQPGLVPVQNVAMANALKRPINDSVAVVDKRMRMA